MSSEKSIRIEIVADFKGEDAVLVAMTAAGLEVLREALRNAAEEPARGALPLVGEERLLIRVKDAPTTLGREDGTLVWTLSASKLQEIVEKLDALRNASGPCHHYVDISEPVGTLVLSRDEYI